MTIRRSFAYNAIVVVQSLLANDEPTGRILFDDVIAPAASRSGIDARFFEIGGPRDLIRLIDELGREALRTKLQPVVHFEMHGRADGLYPAGEILAWDELRPALQRLNGATSVNLLLTLATCYGAYLVNTIHPESTAPFWGLIGPGEQVMESEVRRGYGAFYKSLAAEPDLWAAFDALRNAVTFPDHWELYLAEIILALGFGRYYDANSGPGRLQRAERQAMKLLRRQAAKTGRRPAKRAEVRRIAGDHEGVFKRFKDRFLMLDQQPSNANRFPLSMDEALQYYELNEAARRRRDEEG